MDRTPTCNPLELALLFDRPEKLSEIKSWHRHLPFAFCAIELLRPGVFVELGTHNGDSYCGFCQAVEKLQTGTQCFAVDTWAGDIHAGLYENEIYNNLKQYHDPRYQHFSSLLKMTFDEAQNQFDDGVVDLLHIDGLHTYEAVRHDFYSWLPKLSDQAVVIFHDTSVKTHDFEVWRLWEELRGEYDGFEFSFGYGLGILLVGKAVPEKFKRLLGWMQVNAQRADRFFEVIGSDIVLNQLEPAYELLVKRLDNIGADLGYARSIVEQRDSELRSANKNLAYTTEVVEQRDQQIKDLTHKLRTQESEHLHTLTQFAQRTQKLQEETERKNKIVTMLVQVTESRLWRIRNALMKTLGASGRVIAIPNELKTTQQGFVAERKIDIIIPVYKGKAETKACIKSVLQSSNSFRSSFELIVINDASPDEELVKWLAKHSHAFTLLHNEKNQGFVATVNRAMALHPGRDVVLLNSDTEVNGNWLDRLHRVAYKQENIGTVTPLSNNATLCSYPANGTGGEMLPGYSLAELDQLCVKVNTGVTVQIPTAVGFCMYIKRACLHEMGSFDEGLFGLGYGEENEFCIRTTQRGWKHILAGEIFVFHAGGVSFEATQSRRQRLGAHVLAELYPKYDAWIADFFRQDPTATLRFALDIARVRQQQLPIILMITHGRGGGTERHIQELIEGLQGIAAVLVLRPYWEKNRLAALSLTFDGNEKRHIFNPTTGYTDLLELLRTISVERILFHHIVDVNPSLLNMPADLGVRYDFYIHDYYLACPQITMTDKLGKYCGEPDSGGCKLCLEERPALGTGSDIKEWREKGQLWLYGADRVFTPSEDTRARLLRYFPNANIIVAPHEGRPDTEVRVQNKLATEQPIKVVILGALGIFKGADLLAAVALKARWNRQPLEFHLLGYAYRNLPAWPFSNLTVHGQYKEDELASLLDKLSPDIAWFPGSCPETYSYTLSTCLQLGLPVIAPDIGAFPERLAGRPLTWLLEANASVDDALGKLLEVRKFLIKRMEPGDRIAVSTPPGFSFRHEYLSSTLPDGASTKTEIDWNRFHQMVEKLRHYTASIVEPSQGLWQSMKQQFNRIFS